MSNGRIGRRNKGGFGREPGGFVAIPWSVLDSAAYVGLSNPARALLLEIARQFVRDNNGRLLCSPAFMNKRGWHSNDTLNRAKRELLDAGFIFETVKGHRPNKASWYAITWQLLDKIPGYDAGVESVFQRGAYALNEPLKNASLSPPIGTVSRPIAPPHGTGAMPTAPPVGPIRGNSDTSPTPPVGHHLDKPSACVGD